MRSVNRPFIFLSSQEARKKAREISLAFIHADFWKKA